MERSRGYMSQAKLYNNPNVPHWLHRFNQRNGAITADGIIMIKWYRFKKQGLQIWDWPPVTVNKPKITVNELPLVIDLVNNYNFLVSQTVGNFERYDEDRYDEWLKEQDIYD